MIIKSVTVSVPCTGIHLKLTLHMLILMFKKNLDPDDSQTESDVSNNDDMMSVDDAIETDFKSVSNVFQVSGDGVTLGKSSDGSIRAIGNQVMDYRLRGNCLRDVCLWDFLVIFEKFKRKKILKKSNQTSVDNDESDNCEEEPQYSHRTEQSGSHDAYYTQNCRFLPNHPESNTHELRSRQKWNYHVPVPIASTSIPRRDCDDTQTRYCWLMLILFKPWSSGVDIRERGQLWIDVFENYAENFSTIHLKVMENIQRLHECKDSKDDHFANRRSRASQLDIVSPEVIAASSSNDPDNIENFNDEDELDALNHILNSKSVRSEWISAELTLVQRAVMAVKSSNLYNGLCSPQSSNQMLAQLEPHCMISSNDPEKQWHNSYVQRKKNWKKL